MEKKRYPDNHIISIIHSHELETSINIELAQN